MQTYPTTLPLPAGVQDRTATIAGQRFHYLEAGAGDPLVVLVHGWPQDAYEWIGVMPRLAAASRVVAIDLPGVGGSTSPSREFTKDAVARQLHAFVEGLHAPRIVVVGHDIGGMVAYAYARQFAAQLSGAIVLDVPLPGIGDWDAVVASEEAWHFRFHAQDPLVEDLVEGRQARYFRYFVDAMSGDPGAIGDGAVAHYAGAYASRAQLSAGFGFYRAFERDAAANRAGDGPLAVPLLIVGGERSLGESGAVIARDLRTRGAKDVRDATIAGAGHWLAEEAPDALCALIEGFVADVAGGVSGAARR